MSETETEGVLRKKPTLASSKPRFSAAMRRLLKGGGRAGDSQGEIMSSLSKINGQLGQLLSKLNQPPPVYPETLLHAGLPQDRDVAPSFLSGSQRSAIPSSHSQAAVPFHSKQPGYEYWAAVSFHSKQPEYEYWAAVPFHSKQPGYEYWAAVPFHSKQPGYEAGMSPM